jgi:sRNA-binding protein
VRRCAGKRRRTHERRRPHRPPGQPIPVRLLSGRRRPPTASLKIGVHKDLQAAKAVTGLSLRELKLVLTMYTRSAGYLASIRERAARIGLDGQPAGTVTVEEEPHAIAKVIRLDAEAAAAWQRAREAAQQKRQQRKEAKPVAATMKPAPAAPKRLSLARRPRRTEALRRGRATPAQGHLCTTQEEADDAADDQCRRRTMRRYSLGRNFRRVHDACKCGHASKAPLGRGKAVGTRVLDAMMGA